MNQIAKDKQSFDIIAAVNQPLRRTAMPKENARNKIIGFIEDGLLDWEMVCRECLQRMSCDDIDDMIRECDWDDDHPCYE